MLVHYCLRCSELTAATAADFRPSPAGFLPLVEEPSIRQWALDVHMLWNELYRVVRCSQI